jgi:tetratricopeptide (TPR) repeat protein
MPKYRSALILGCVLCAAPLFAMGGGGGGGSSSASPSESAPAYDPAVEYQKGITALKAKDFKTAKRAFDRVLAAAPKDANTQYLAGLSRTGLLDYKGATKFLEKAVKLDPELIGAHRELGIAYAKSGAKPKAETTLAALKAKAATCGASCARAAELKAAIDAVAAALSGTTAAALDAPPSLLFASQSQGDTRYLAAVSLINEGRFEEAITTLKASQEAFGPHPDILTYLGFANRKLKRFDVAEGYYRAALLAAPFHRGATEYFGELMVERGDLPNARKMLARLDAQCRFGCAEAEELRAWIAAGHSPHSAG